MVFNRYYVYSRAKQKIWIIIRTRNKRFDFRAPSNKACNKFHTALVYGTNANAEGFVFAYVR